MAATPALAQHISPANTNFDAIGPAQLTKGATSLSCTLTLSGTTGPDVGGGVADGGTITGGTNTGPGNCPLLTVDGGATFEIDTSTGTGGTGSLYNLVVRLAGTPVCSDAGPLPFTVINNGSGPSTIQFNSPVDPDCVVLANLSTTPDINVVP
ncbi:hypothetical protein D2V04_03915 [Pelagerythrobacter aerophilus]|uniref:Protein activator of alkane oxidation PraB n=2 Tax=Pelagerythrobacter aerophilus TaxID=2306995 RepID=A0A418NIY7_9SPHN|nr:hypothetical protein D2V04_03915 [Pelagerythrobacter aerophilus]